MNQAIDAFTAVLNRVGQAFWPHAAGLFMQSALLIVLLIITDLLLQKRIRAVFRYGLWMLLFVKLVLPASFSLPTGIGNWVGEYLTPDVAVTKSMPPIEARVPMVFEGQPRPMPLEARTLLEPTPMPETPRAGVEHEPIDWKGLAYLGWLSGMLVLSVLLVKRACFVKRLVAQGKAADERLLRLLDECCCRIGIQEKIDLRISDTMLSPAVCGLFRPVVLIPNVLLERFSPDKLKAVLMHELAHVKRADVWVNLLQTICQIVYFYNPFIWIANTLIRRAREQAVDEVVLVTLKPETRQYSNTLLDIAEMSLWRPSFSLGLIGVVESKKALERRIRHMLNRPAPKSSKLGNLGLMIIVVIGAVILPMGRNPAEQTALAASVNNQGIADNKIVLGIRVGEYTFDMSKDDVLKRLGKPGVIFYGNEKYSLDNPPENYYMPYEDISFRIQNNSVRETTVLSPSYRLPNGLGVGDPEQKIKEALGADFRIREFKAKDFLSYEDKGLMFEIDKRDRTVMEINVSPIDGPKSRAAHIPATSVINEQGHIVDKTDYPFVNDPKVVGGWRSVDFVQNINDFDPAKKNWGDLYLNHLVFEEEGRIAGNFLTWTKDLVLSDDTASKYIIKEIDGSSYMFFEWKSGDYTIRHMRPRYYVLRKVLAESLKYEPMFGEKAYIPPTSTINDQGHIVDKTDYPFIHDPEVIGTWQSVDYVDEKGQFRVDKKKWKGRGGKLFLHEMIFADKGRLISKNDNAPDGYALAWTKGLVISDGRSKKASQYTLKDINGATYMFFEWKSGDYTYRYQKPSYYVLKKVSSNTGEPADARASQFGDAEFARLLPARIEQLDIDTAGLEQVKAIFGKPAQYVWGKETFTEEKLPRHYILVYPGRFRVFMREDKIVELRHERGSAYVFRDTLRCGSTLDDVFDLLGPPEDTVEGEENGFEDGILYRDIEGRKGHCYYARSDQNVRVWFWDYKVIAIYMTCSDYHDGGTPRKAYLGIELNDQRWPLVNVIPDMPAAQAGMQNGDKILIVNGQDMSQVTTLQGALAALKCDPDDKVKLTILRGEQILDFEVEPTDRLPARAP